MRLKQALMRPSEKQAPTELPAAVSLNADLPFATELGQFELVYQPVLDLAAAEVLGWEALVRWQHPEHGTVSPAEFLPAAEVSGDILTIGGWVLNRACEDFARTLSCSDQPARWVSVNISARQLQEPDFADTVRHALHRWELQPGSLIIEVTEDALGADTPSAVDALTSLRSDGVRIALDDFGGGSASLGVLQQQPVDIIKIDRSLVAMSSESHSDMFDVIVALGDALSLDMIAEGIEEAAELERVMGFAGVAGQGYYLARPMSILAARTFTLESQSVQ
jgi:EAL domain-containing protein (putative c-di-GMP-specific phosphodiesterase class I)